MARQLVAQSEERRAKRTNFGSRLSALGSPIIMSTRLAVIGAGPGGYVAAFHAADLGMQVTLIDADPNPGGVCTFRGCIPSKALLHAARVLDEAKHADAYGVSFGSPSIDVNKLRAWKDQVVKKQTGGLGLLAKSRKVTYIQGRASFVDAKTLSVETSGGEQKVQADYVIVATGSRPTTVPNVSIDSPKVLDSTTALELPDVPNRLLVVGGGYIGLELGTVYAALGSKVTVVEMTDGLLPGADRDLAAIVAKRMATYAEAILLETKVTGVKDDKKGLAVIARREERAVRRRKSSIACSWRWDAVRTPPSAASTRRK